MPTMRCIRTFQAPWRSGLGTTRIEAGEFVAADAEYVEDYPANFVDGTKERAAFRNACRMARLRYVKRRGAVIRVPRAARAVRPRSRSVRTSPRAANAPPDADDPSDPPGDAPHAVEPRGRSGDLLPARRYLIPVLDRLARVARETMGRAA